MRTYFLLIILFLVSCNTSKKSSACIIGGTDGVTDIYVKEKAAQITYRNGYILNKKGKIIGNYANGHIFDKERNIKGFYSNGFIYDKNHNIIGNYNNGFVMFKKKKQIIRRNNSPGASDPFTYKKQT